jgi:hypothetical protein
MWGCPPAPSGDVIRVRQVEVAPRPQHLAVECSRERLDGGVEVGDVAHQEPAEEEGKDGEKDEAAKRWGISG